MSLSAEYPPLQNHVTLRPRSSSFHCDSNPLQMTFVLLNTFQFTNFILLNNFFLLLKIDSSLIQYILIQFSFPVLLPVSLHLPFPPDSLPFCPSLEENRQYWCPVQKVVSYVNMFKAIPYFLFYQVKCVWFYVEIFYLLGLEFCDLFFIHLHAYIQFYQHYLLKMFFSSVYFLLLYQKSKNIKWIPHIWVCFVFIFIEF